MELRPGRQYDPEKLLVHASHARTFWKVIFWIWGFLGLISAIGFLIALTGEKSVGVGTSAYVSALMQVWIGGMVLFGIVALTSGEQKLRGPIPIFVVKAPPETRGFDGQLYGIAYRELAGGIIEGELGDGLVRFSNWKEFTAAARHHGDRT